MPVKRNRSSGSAPTAKKAATIKPKNDSATVHRGVTIMLPKSEVRRLWKQKDFPGKAEYADAPGDRGTELRVTATAKQQRAIKELVTAFQGDVAHDQLSTALREFKAKVETGEIPTIEGQPSGRNPKKESPQTKNKTRR